MSVLWGILALLHTANGLMLKNGSYVLCSTTPEQFARHSTGSIAGGFDTIHSVERQPCSELTQNDKWHRTYDGTCNTKADLGAAFSVVKRLLPPYYKDKNSAPRDLARDGSPMTGAREISLAVHRPKEGSSHFSLMLMQMGQFLDHDTSVVTVATEFNDTLACCGVPPAQQYVDCYPIKTPPGDRAFKGCIEFVRSDPVVHANGTLQHPRAHRNAITAWLDASMIYGSDRNRAKELRTRNGTGALLATTRYKGKERLPKGHSKDCINLKDSHFCALAGDDRTNEQPGLTALHTIFHLEHNRLVRKLVTAVLYRSGRPYSSRHVQLYLHTCPDKIQDRLYQVVRKVMGGVWQRIVYGEYLPVILGPEVMSKFQLTSWRRVPFRPDIDPSISEEFLTCAFRFGHTLVNDMMLTDKMRNLKELFSTSEHNLEHFNNIVRGLVSPVNHAEPYDTAVAGSLVDDLFANGERKFDLAALNIQRGRDHGIGRLNEMRKFFGLAPFTKWEQFGEAGAKLKSVYRHIDDVECFPGGTAEQPVQGGVVGATFAHIIAQQFHDLKFGDRYFFQTDSPYYGFSRREMWELKKLSFSKILCENGQMLAIQRNPFILPHSSNPEFLCRHFTDIDMWYWARHFLY